MTEVKMLKHWIGETESELAEVIDSIALDIADIVDDYGWTHCINITISCDTDQFYVTTFQRFAARSLVTIQIDLDTGDDMYGHAGFTDLLNIFNAIGDDHEEPEFINA